MLEGEMCLKCSCTPERPSWGYRCAVFFDVVNKTEYYDMELLEAAVGDSCPTTAQAAPWTQGSSTTPDTTDILPDDNQTTTGTVRYDRTHDAESWAICNHCSVDSQWSTIYQLGEWYSCAHPTCLSRRPYPWKEADLDHQAVSNPDTRYLGRIKPGPVPGGPDNTRHRFTNFLRGGMQTKRRGPGQDESASPRLSREGTGNNQSLPDDNTLETTDRHSLEKQVAKGHTNNAKNRQTI
jgi:hypothetical protein